MSVVCGDESPKIHGNVWINLDWKGFSVNTSFYLSVWGGQMYNQTLVDKVENCDMNYNVDYRGIYREGGQLPDKRQNLRK